MLPFLFFLLLTLVSAVPLDVAASAFGDSTYDFEELHKYAHLSAVSYCIENGLHEGVLGWEGAACPSKSCTYPSIKYLKIHKVFNFSNWLEVGSGFIALEHDSERIYVVFRGTASTQDWVSNFEFIRSSYKPLVDDRDSFKVVSEESCKDCSVHKGFNTFIRTNAEQIVREVVKLKKKHPDYNLVVTGHSLGAALATLAGVEFRLLGYDTLVITFGGPKIGNRNFVRFVDQLFQTDRVTKYIAKHSSFDLLSNGLIRATHVHDLVPMLPPGSEYKQCGFQYYLSARGPRQTPDSVIRKGVDYIEDDELLDYKSMLKSTLSRGDHVNYFFKITDCQDL